MEEINEYYRMKELIEELEQDVLKFYENDNKSAGTRCSLAMRELRQLSITFRRKVLKRRKQF